MLITLRTTTTFISKKLGNFYSIETYYDAKSNPTKYRVWNRETQKSRDYKTYDEAMNYIKEYEKREKEEWLY